MQAHPLPVPVRQFSSCAASSQTRQELITGHSITAPQTAQPVELSVSVVSFRAGICKIRNIRSTQNGASAPVCIVACRLRSRRNQRDFADDTHRMRGVIG
jgi:hypothetical protein